MIDAIGGRKVVVVGVATLVGVALVLLKGDVPPNFLTLLQFGVGFFVAGNVGEHFAGTMASKTVTIDETMIPDPTEQLAAINSQNEEIKAALANSQQGIATILQIAGVGRKPQ